MSKSENALTAFHQTTALADPDAFNAAISKAQSKAPAVSTGNPYLKMSRHDGSWSYGAEDIEVEEGSKWAINPYSLKHGLPDNTSRTRWYLGRDNVV